MEAILFYHEDNTLISNQRRMIDAWCAMAGMFPIMVDKTGSLRQTNNNVFSTIQDAIAAFPDHKWVFMSMGGVTLLKDFVHPQQNVIYCVGSDTDGFQDLDLSNKITVRVQYADGRDNSWYASTIVPIVIAHRMFN